MSTVTLTSPRPRRTAGSAPRAQVTAALAACLHLVPSVDGWALTQPGGELVYAAPGREGRRRCLEFARDHGVAALIS